jgi:hypothetical protein
MRLKELIDTMAYGTHYKLIGAKTGKHLADSITNKAGYINAFLEDDVLEFFPAFDAQKSYITKVPEHISPIICIWLSGR